MDKNDPIIKALLEEDKEFHILFAEHEELEKKLSALDSSHYLTPQQDLERKTIQKTKLRGRDRMEEIIRRSRSGALSA